MTDFATDTLERRFTRKRILRAGKTFFWVSCVTVLIWIYADLEKTETDEFHVKLRLSLGTNKDLAFLGGSDMKHQDLDVTFRASGSRSGLDRCHRNLAEQAGALTADLSTYPPGQHQVQVAEILRRAEPVRDSGLSEVSANPSSVSVDLAEVITVSDVEVSYPDKTVEASVVPPRMGLTVAQKRWEELTKSGAKPVLTTGLVNPAAQADANKPLRVEVVPFVSGVPVQPVSPFVEVFLKTNQTTVERKLKVPIRVQTPPGWAEDDTWQRFVLKREDPLGWQKEISFRGPQKEIEKLRPEDVDAYVPLREDDKTKTEAWLKRDVEIRLPRDSQIQVAGEKPSVLFRLESRPAPAPTP
jgi:hypothetical protein